MTRACSTAAAQLAGLAGLVFVACGAQQGAVPRTLVAAENSFPAPPREADPVQLELVANVSRPQSNGDFLLAARFRIAPGWHIYWSNPGDVGLATAVEFELPRGSSRGPLQYPGPRSFAGVGGLVSYGYIDDVMISARIRVPLLVDRDTAVLRVHARWLACRDECRPGHADATLRLRRADASPNSALFAAHRASLPLDGVTSRCELSLSTTGTEALVACADANVVEFFPATEATQMHGPADSDRQTTKTKRRGSPARSRRSSAAVRIDIGQDEDFTKVSGVLRVESAGQSRYYAMSPVDFLLGSTSAISQRPAAPPFALVRDRGQAQLLQ